MSVVRVGVGVIVLNAHNQILMCKRKSALGQGTWAIIGGHIEFGETIEECAKREVLEETGLIIGEPKIVTSATHFFDDGAKHYISIYLVTRVIGGALELREPDKISEFKWIDDWNDLPTPLFVNYPSVVNRSLIK